MEKDSALRQLWFSFVESLKTRLPARREARPLPVVRRHLEEPQQAEADPQRASGPPTPAYDEKLDGRDTILEHQGREWLDRLGQHEGAMKLRVEWNRKLRSTAGYARWPMWRVELNPRLVDFEGQVERTFKHELAHLIAYSRAGRKRIEPHGPEWHRACADLGIPDETARHTLPLPRSRQTRHLVYQCPACGVKVERVKRFQRYTACLACCRKHNGGRYDARFQFVLAGKMD